MQHGLFYRFKSRENYQCPHLHKMSSIFHYPLAKKLASSSRYKKYADTSLKWFFKPNLEFRKFVLL